MEKIENWKIENFRLINLGDKKQPLLFLEPKLKAKKRLLVAAGFHGDEIAGVLGIKKFLESYKPDQEVAVTFLPLVNESGFQLGRRYNKWGENPNRGFCHQSEIPNSKSREGQILAGYREMLVEAGKDGFLTLHEDPNHEMFYIYTFEKETKPGMKSEQLMAIGAAEFGQCGDGKIVNKFADATDESSVIEGFCINKHDGSFEDWLWEEGVAYAVCTETPMKADLDRRIKTNTELIKKFISLA